jgi:hypothetical protein
LLAAVLGAAVLVAASCGDDGGPSEEAAATETTPAPTTTTTTTTSTSTTTSTLAPSEPDDEAIVAAFERYQTALESGDGEAAVAAVSSGTFEFYEEIRDLAVSADEQALVGDIPLLEGITIVRLRAGLGEQVASMSGEDLVRWGVDSGLVGDPVGTVVLDSVQPGEEGEAFGVIGGVPLFRFVLEGEEWKVDLPYTVDRSQEVAGEDLLIQQLSAGEASTKEELFVVLATSLGTTWEEISQPLRG